MDGDYVIELMNKYAKSRVKLTAPKHSPETVMKIDKTVFCQDITHHRKCEIIADPVSRQHKASESDTWLAKMILYDT